MQGFKVGPDYIDPSYHALASGRPGRNLDAFLSGPELIAPLVRHGSAGADVAVIEGVMGMFDGASGRGELASTAHVAKLLQAPVVLVVDAGAMARSAAAIVHGYRTFDPEVDVAGVIFNRVGSDHHEELLREATADVGVPVLGALRRDDRVVAPERHLGLVPAAERAAQTRAALDALAQAAARYVDLDAVERLARAAPPADGPAWEAGAGRRAGAGAHRDRTRPGVLVPLRGEPRAARRGRRRAHAVRPDRRRAAARGRRRARAGRRLPRGLRRRAGGQRRRCAQRWRRSPQRGRPILAECGGLLYLCAELDGQAMCGVLPARGRMAGRLTLGYREATAATATPWIAAGASLRGHEFHYSAVEPIGAGARPRGR